MDQSVALVQAYLNANGYFTVAEYPVVERDKDGGWRAATDLDIMAVRFPAAGSSHGASRGSAVVEPDPLLGLPEDRIDMIVGEVKEGRTALNPAIRDPSVLGTALVRFGCCGHHDSAEIVRRLGAEARATTPAGHHIRVVAFGSYPHKTQAEREIGLQHIVDFLNEHLRRQWPAFRQTQLKGNALGFLAMLEKARRGSP